MARILTNDFSELRLLSLRRLAMASEIHPRDARGPYIVVQRGSDPNDPSRTQADFLLGRSGAWLATHWFLRLPVEDRRHEFVFGTVAEVANLIDDLPLEVKVASPHAAAASESSPDDELVRLLSGCESGPGGAPAPTSGPPAP